MPLAAPLFAPRPADTLQTAFCLQPIVRAMETHFSRCEHTPPAIRVRAFVVASQPPPHTTLGRDQVRFRGGQGAWPDPSSPGRCTPYEPIQPQDPASNPRTIHPPIGHPTH